MDGIISVYKEKGYTSHDVVAKMRGILKQKKIGHTGTLDPAAEGVLPVCLGRGTRLCDLLTDKSKTYRAVMLLGVETDTQDTTGTVLEERPLEASEAEVRQAVLSFVGHYDQVPPMYSALKVKGRKLCDLAREGVVVERKARPVVIESIVIESMDLPRVTMTVECSKGTYIRTLCHDIGKKLGCGAAMESLLRTRVGMFTLENSLKLSEIQELMDAGRLSGRVAPVDSVFAAYPCFLAPESLDKKLRNGNPFYEEEGGEKLRLLLSCPGGAAGEGTDASVRVYDSAGAFIGLYGREGRLMKPIRIFLGGG